MVLGTPVTKTPSIFDPISPGAETSSEPYQQPCD